MARCLSRDITDSMVPEETRFSLLLQIQIKKTIKCLHFTEVNCYSIIDATGGKSYHVKADLHTKLIYYLHEDWRSVIHEHVCTYDVNGVKGYGTFEFLYKRRQVLVKY